MAKSRRKARKKASEIDSVLPSSERDFRPLERLIRRTLGRGFKLAVVETHAPIERQAILERVATWIEPGGANIQSVYLPDLPVFNLWHELKSVLNISSESLEKSVIALWGIEEIPGTLESDRPVVFEQLNVQRDLFVRDFPCPWILFIHPSSRLKLMSVAPDFSDFVALWLEASEPVNDAASPVPETLLLNQLPPPVTLPADTDSDSSFLQQAYGALSRWELDRAKDFLASFEMSASPNQTLHGYYLLLRGQTELLSGKANLARDFFERSLASYSAAGNSNGEALARSLLARAECNLGARAVAADLAQAGVEYFEKTSNQWMLAQALRQIGTAEAGRLGRNKEARSAFVRSAELHKRIGAFGESATTLSLLADMEFKRGRQKRARQLTDEAIALLRAADIQERSQTTYATLAMLESNLGSTEAARDLVLESLEIQTELDGKPGRAASLFALGNLEMKNGDLERAREHFEESLDLLEQVGEQATRAAFLLSLARLERQLGELKRARDLARAAISFFVKTGQAEGRALGLVTLAQILAASGDTKQALIAGEEAVEALQRVESIWLPVVRKSLAAIHRSAG